MFFSKEKREQKRRKRELRNQLREGIRTDNNTMIAEALENGAEPNDDSGGGISLLTWILARDNFEGAKLLIEAGAKVDINPNDTNNSLLHTLASSSDEESSLPVFEQFLQKDGADIEMRNSMEETLLITACTWNNYKIVELLLEKGADPNARDQLDGTALHSAAFNGNIEIMELLLSYNSEVNAVRELGGNVLCSAVGSANADVIPLLIKSGADINHTNDDGETPLHLACRKGQEDIYGESESKIPMIFELIASGANTEITNHEGRKPIEYCKDDPIILHQIFKKSADIRAKKLLVYIDTAMICQSEDLHSDALWLLERAIEVFPDKAEPHKYLSTLLTESGDQQTGMDHLIIAAKMGDEDSKNILKEFGIELE
jgi:ankyrin repeat protein